MNKLVAIHQPNFFPWLGYFDKLARSDTFVVLDDAQFPKKGGTWINRVRMAVHGGPAWVTVPVDRSYHGVREIREMRIDESTPWREKMLRTVEGSYAGAPCFDAVFPIISELIETSTDELAGYNLNALRALAAELGIDQGKLVLSSELGVEGAATERLISLVKEVGGDAYLAGGGASGYQEDDRFAQAGLGLVSQDFRHPSYPQALDPPVEGLSVIDALMNCGFKRTAALMGIGSENPR